MSRILTERVAGLLVLLLGLTTLLFFLLRMTGDPVATLIGPEATAEQIETVRREYGLDRPLTVQYGIYISNLLRLDLGTSLQSGEPALAEVLARLPATMLLACIAMIVALALAIPVGTWLGARPNDPARRGVSGIVFLLQGTPGFVIGLILIQLVAVRWRLLPSMGYDEVESWILPALTLASFLAPKLTRVVAANVTESLREDYVRTARANGASDAEALWRHALPNALLGAAALVGTQFAYLISGSILVETLFGWPGIGWLLLESTQTLDFPVVQATAIVVAILVFVVNTSFDALFRLLDPRLADARS